jgi:ribosomal protein L11 methyltransferase
MPPPEKLFVYEIKGRFSPPPALTGEDFLGSWREADYTYLFFAGRKEDQVRAWLNDVSAAACYSSETVLNFADWEAGLPLKPTRVAGFYFCPIWEEPAPEPGDMVLRMEPGLAFGSGHHPTTRLCLELICRVFKEDPPRRVLDLGAGTGVLTLAALALGTERVVAVEYNDLAARTARRNFRHNLRGEQALLIQGDARDFAYPAADLALANIHLDLLLDLIKIPEFLNKQWYIFSGLMGPQLDPFLTGLSATHLKALEVLDENMWFAVLARNTSRER